MFRRNCTKAAAAVVLALAAPAAGPDRGPVLVLDDRRARRRVNALADRFNGASPSARSYRRSRAHPTARCRPRSPRPALAMRPHIVQVFEVGTATMMGARRHQAGRAGHEQAGDKFDPLGLHSGRGRLLHHAQGRDAVVPVQQFDGSLLLQPDAFKKAGVDKVPETWPEVVTAAAKVKASAATPCGFTTGWQSWVQLENFSAWHNVPIGHRNNGFDSADVTPHVNTPLHERHIANLATWAKNGLFIYAGRRNEPEAKFYSGDCAMVTSSSCRLRQHQAQRQVRLRHRQAAVLLGRQGGAAEFDHRRCQPLGHGRQDRRPTTRAWPDSSASCRGPTSRPSGTRRPATCRSPWPPTSRQKIRLLRQEPWRRRLGRTDGRQDHGQVARRETGQLHPDPRHRRRGDGERLVRQADGGRSAQADRRAWQRAVGALREDRKE